VEIELDKDHRYIRYAALTADGSIVTGTATSAAFGITLLALVVLMK
jgi:hypothetical protein